MMIPGCQDSRPQAGARAQASLILTRPGGAAGLGGARAGARLWARLAWAAGWAASGPEVLGGAGGCPGLGPPEGRVSTAWRWPLQG